MLKNFLIFLAWVGACTLVYYNVKWAWAMPVFALGTLLIFLAIAIVRSGKKAS
ncbi:hypothetical protein [Hymenobacter nivis]|uniref:hypothetical protein n=1 Tax=Hymenobacter nivis TaxID=1850093 RepID=UPI0013761DE7|nr:hypothetical protein [Hymenobacter nivis]